MKTFIFVALIVATAAEDRCIILAGGFGGNSVPEFYHPDDGTECQLDGVNMSTELLDKTTFTSGCYLAETNQIIVRESGFLFNRKDSVLYNLNDGTAETIPNPQGGNNRAFYPSSTVQNGKCFSCGGFNGVTAIGECYIYDPETKNWNAGPVLPIGRGGTATVALGDNVYVTGGANFGEGPIFSDIYRYTGSGEFELAGSLIKGRESHSAVKLDENRILMCGGEALPEGRLDTCEIFDQTTGEVTSAGSLKSARSGYGLMSFNGRVIAVAGRYPQNQQVDGTVEEFNKETNSWTVIKNLKSARFSSVHVVV